MSERSSDWRCEDRQIRFPEDNDVIGVPITAVRRAMTDDEKRALEFIKLAVGDYGYTHPETQGTIVVWQEPRAHSSFIMRVPYETPGSI